MDDFSARKVVHAIAPSQPRDYVIMEVKSNLIRADRKAMLQRFSNPCFKKVAHVFMGEPSKTHLKRVQKTVLKEKQEAENTAFRIRKLERERLKLVKERQNAVAAAKKEADDKRKTKTREGTPECSCCSKE